VVPESKDDFQRVWRVMGGRWVTRRIVLRRYGKSDSNVMDERSPHSLCRIRLMMSLHFLRGTPGTQTPSNRRGRLGRQ